MSKWQPSKLALLPGVPSWDRLDRQIWFPVSPLPRSCAQITANLPTPIGHMQPAVEKGELSTWDRACRFMLRYATRLCTRSGHNRDETIIPRPD